MRHRDILKEYYSPEDDKLSVRGKQDTRRPKISLKQLNKIRKRRELKKFEEEKRKRSLPLIYGADQFE